MFREKSYLLSTRTLYNCEYYQVLQSENQWNIAKNHYSVTWNEFEGSFGGLLRFSFMISTKNTVKRHNFFYIFSLNTSSLLLGDVAIVFMIKLMYILVDNDILGSHHFKCSVKHPNLLSTRIQIVNIAKFSKQVID